jgi:hypothetical protein
MISNELAARVDVHAYSSLVFIFMKDMVEQQIVSATSNMASVAHDAPAPTCTHSCECVHIDLSSRSLDSKPDHPALRR